MGVDRLTGYAHPDYGRSLEEFGEPRTLPRSGATILSRQIGAGPHRDGMGCYPIFVCADWLPLEADLDEVANELVCVSAVTDPFGDYDLTTLQRAFKHVVQPFKHHYVVDLERYTGESGSTHHRRNTRKASRLVDVERCGDVDRVLPDWMALYANLVRRRGIRGIAAFSTKSFVRQMKVPGLTAFRAVHRGRTVGMSLWYVQRRVGYYHLGAYSDEGYTLGASFPLFREAIEHFRIDGLKWLNLGGAAGLAEDRHDGLSRFKKGWATGTRTAYLCGRIFDQQRYDEFVRDRRIVTTRFFPAYREVEWDR